MGTHTKMKQKANPNRDVRRVTWDWVSLFDKKARGETRLPLMRKDFLEETNRIF
jgi:hypothetical protein